MEKYNHTEMFPEDLVKRVLHLFSYRHDIILDPYNGVGTTTAVAKELGRNYCGIDLSPEYCRVATERTHSRKYQPSLDTFFPLKSK